MSTIIFEPHPDDVFLSLGGHLIQKDNPFFITKDDVTIVTVFNNKKRGIEAQVFADTVGVKSILLNYEESNMSSDFDPRKYIEVQDVIRNIVHKTEKESGEDKFKNRYLFPLGLQHPDHRGISPREVKHVGEHSKLHPLYPLFDWSIVDKIHYYVEIPYQSKKKNATHLLHNAQHLSIASILYPPRKKWKMSSIFKSQSMFFHFNKNLETANIPELILKHPIE